MPHDSARVRRVEPVDTLRLDDGALVLYKGAVTRLGELGLAIMELCDPPRTIAELAAELTRTFGEPPQGGTTATRDVVGTLLAAGVLHEEAALPPGGQ